MQLMHALAPAQVVYNEYIADRNHIHMNSTNWYVPPQCMQTFNALTTRCAALC